MYIYICTYIYIYTYIYIHAHHTTSYYIIFFRVTGSGAEKEDSNCKQNPNGCNKVPATTNMEPKGCKRTNTSSKTPPAE